MHAIILQGLKEIPFSVGKKLLKDFIQGDSHPSIERNRLHKLPSYGIEPFFDNFDEVLFSLIKNKYINQVSLPGNKFWKVLEISSKGLEELRNPQFHKKKMAYCFKEVKTVITQEEKELFGTLDFYLEKYNDFQKKAIISNKKEILCIAGAGTGKTTVLTKRIDFLTRFRSVNPKKILAITFTRKACEEMKHRIEHPVTIETFNSFCEKILLRNSEEIYGKNIRLINFRERIGILQDAIISNKITQDRVINMYFTTRQRKEKSYDQLMFTFMNDIFSIIDYAKYENKDIDECLDNCKDFHIKDMIKKICTSIKNDMFDLGLRDYSDQLLDAVKYFKSSKNIPQYDYILVDEYQDINSIQIELINLLNPKNIFCVGDPRQSIFGWRGSKINYILDFNKKYKDAETITLVENYRSNTHIVDFINKSITNMKLPNLKGNIEGDKNINIFKAKSELDEQSFIAEKILQSNLPRREIFVLARTNRQLKALSDVLSVKKIKHVVRFDEQKKRIEVGPDDVTLSTIHSIKGLEAKLVILMGATIANFPCKVSDHPVVDMIKSDDYDKEEEERRLFYVALSRAKDQILITHTGTKPTWFLNKDMLKIVEKSKQVTFQTPTTNNLYSELKSWRYETSQDLGIPPFMVMHDKTLLELTEKVPGSMNDLESIHGFGKTRIKKFGEDVLAIINS